MPADPTPPPESPFSALHNVLVFNARDWAANRTDAWPWGIIVGWDAASLKELALGFRWSAGDVARLKRLRKCYVEAYAKDDTACEWRAPSDVQRARTGAPDVG